MKLRAIEDIDADVEAGGVHAVAALFKDEPEVLYRYARKSPGPIVEIGTYAGGGTCLLAKASRDGCGELVYAIDRHESTAPHTEGSAATPYKLTDWKRFMLEVISAEAYDLIRPVGLWSHEAVPAFQTTQLGLVFIDGAHVFRAVTQDLKDWAPLVHPEGWIITHDLQIPGVRKAVEQWLGSADCAFEIIETAGSLAVFARKHR